LGISTSKRRNRSQRLKGNSTCPANKATLQTYQGIHNTRMNNCKLFRCSGFRYFAIVENTRGRVRESTHNIQRSTFNAQVRPGRGFGFTTKTRRVRGESTLNTQRSTFNAQVRSGWGFGFTTNDTKSARGINAQHSTLNVQRSSEVRLGIRVHREGTKAEKRRQETGGGKGINAQHPIAPTASTRRVSCS